MRGRVAFSGGEPAAGAWIALVDRDPEYDDLLGVGVANERGEFRLTFTAEAFNQEVGEEEERPDLYAIVSIPRVAGISTPVLRRDFPDLRFDAEEDLGLITLPLDKGAEPQWAKGLRPSPGATKLVRRVHLDDELVAHAAREVVSVVEHLTGWNDLLGGVKIAIVDDFHELQERSFAAHLGRTRLTEAERELAAERAEGCDVRLMGLWDNRERTIFLNRPVMEVQNYDALKVVLGHELVHVGQSLRYPEVDAAITAYQKVALERAFSGERYSREELNDFTRFMANIEGYAMHVEEALLEVFTHGTTIMSSKVEARIRSIDRRRATAWTHADIKDFSEKSWREILEASASNKSSQYEAGRVAYRERAPGHGVAPFDPAFRPDLHFGDDAMGLLVKAAENGGAVSQYELGVLYLYGKNGVPKDEEKSKEWFRKAAEQGLASAQHLYGLQLVKESNREGVALVERAAEQGLVAAMESLVTIYEKGLLVPRDIVKGRIWKKRATAKK